MEVTREIFDLVVYIGVEAEGFFSLDNTSLGALAHFSGVGLVLISLNLVHVCSSGTFCEFSSLYSVSLTYYHNNKKLLRIILVWNLT